MTLHEHLQQASIVRELVAVETCHAVYCNHFVVGCPSFVNVELSTVAIAGPAAMMPVSRLKGEV